MICGSPLLSTSTGGGRRSWICKQSRLIADIYLVRWAEVTATCVPERIFSRLGGTRHLVARNEASRAKLVVEEVTRKGNSTTAGGQGAKARVQKAATGQR